MAYASDWRLFTTWAKRNGRAHLPAIPETVALYMADLASTRKPATITRYLAAIAKAHQAAGYESPCAMRHACVKEVMAGIRREKGIAQRQKAALLTVDIRQMVQAVPDTARGLRDAALLLLGFTGAFRRAELAALRVQDLEFREDGLVVTLRRSKTDQEGQGRKIGIPFGTTPKTCAVRAVRKWLDLAHLSNGPVFRGIDRARRLSDVAITSQVVRLVVRRCCKSVGLEVEKYSAHSLRAGHATQAAINGASERSIMNQTGHRSAAMVRRYIRDAELFRENAATMLGL